jgi:hypothetical protein
MNTTTTSRPWAALAARDVPRRWPDPDCPSDMTWARAGHDWDAVAISLDDGVQALDRGCLPPDEVPVVADYYLRRLYVLVQRGAAATFAGRARVLTRGARILMPRPVDPTARAVWLSNPEVRRLPDASALAAALERPG